MTPSDIADLLSRSKATYAATSTALLLLNHPGAVPALQAAGFDPKSKVVPKRVDGTEYPGLDLYASISLVQNNADYNKAYLRNLFETALVEVGDELKQNALYDGSPELGFFRHLRNAAGHGNRFHFLNNEPRRPAHFGGFVLDAAMDGGPVLFDYLYPGNMLDLFDHVETHLRGLP